MKTIFSENRITYLGILFGAAAVTLAVYGAAWISDDAFITLRYVSNVSNGYGPVFNTGERVQGYTHPLWFMMLLAGSVVLKDPILAAISLGIGLTFLTMVSAGLAIASQVKKFEDSMALTGLFGLILIASNPWLSFQTSGLENSMTHFILTLIAIECIFFQTAHPAWLLALAGLLVLNRPDLVLLVIPISLVALARGWQRRQFGAVILAALPVISWLTFAWIYYGDIIPNTAYAKMGIYTGWDGIRQGWAYFLDWATYDTLAAGSTLIFTGVLLTQKRSAPTFSLAVGNVFYILFIIWIGGDFMRGRFFLPVFFSSLIAGILFFASKVRAEKSIFSSEAGILVFVLLVLYGIQHLPADPGRTINEAGIVNERAFYPQYRLDYYLRHGTIINPYLDLNFADHLRSYTDLCGPITIKYRNPGTIGYFAGPKVNIIDTLGLTDPTIAKLPREYLVASHPRPGHPDKHIPLEYLRNRNDLTLLPDWKQAIYELDCSFLTQIQSD